ncbi:MAG: hypothetical protein NZ920_00680 [Aigarchaeota archaeon]|nr:hypothetical protein [Aigarchaeota archaeon]MDW8092957.1 hypothetical protein [Nitrososphaerota archaeon]
MEVYGELNRELRLERVDCEVCEGVPRRCRLESCPFYAHLIDLSKRLASKESYVSGFTPPNVLVGKAGYPRVQVGPAVSPNDDLRSALTSQPSVWLDRSIDELLTARLSLLLTRRQMRVTEVRDWNRIFEAIALSSMSLKPVDLEVKVIGSPALRPHFFARSHPYGPSARLSEVKVVSNVRVPRAVDDLAHERGLRVADAVKELCERGYDEYYITRLLSIGVLGTLRDRRLVPTEWSITATDDIVSRIYLKGMRDYNAIHDFQLYSSSVLHNKAFVILLPTPWMYELLEGWVRFFSIYSDYEILRPRRDYADNTGGAFYAVRLGLVKSLSRLRKRAGALVIFEIGEGWVPLGVWRFRELVKRALASKPEVHETLDEALKSVRARLELPLDLYLSKSRLYKLLRTQRRLDEYLDQ